MTNTTAYNALKQGEHKDAFNFVKKYFEYNPKTGELDYHTPVDTVKTGIFRGVPGIWVNISEEKKSKRTWITQSHICWLLTHKEWPGGYLKHKDGDKSNNKLDNLFISPTKLAKKKKLSAKDLNVKKVDVELADDEILGPEDKLIDKQAAEAMAEVDELLDDLKQEPYKVVKNKSGKWDVKRGNTVAMTLNTRKAAREAVKQLEDQTETA